MTATVGMAAGAGPVAETDVNLQAVVKFLHSALTMKAKGDGLHYKHLVDQLFVRDDPEMLWRLYLGLAQIVNILSQQPEEYSELTHALFRFDWYVDDKVVAAFSTLLTHLVSANSIFMTPAMQMLVRNMVLTPRDLDGDGKMIAPASRRQRHLHRTLNACLTLVPSGRSRLMDMIRQHYPHRRLPADTIADFGRQALRIVKYAPLIEDSVIRLIIERSLEIDVEIKIMDTGEAVVAEEQEGDALFSMDEVVDGSAHERRKKKEEEVDEMAEKLDSVMLVLLSYLESRLSTKASDRGHDEHTPEGTDTARLRADSSTAVRGLEGTERLLQSLLATFEEKVFPTHRSKFVQFAIFYAAAKAPALGHLLSNKFLDVLRDDSKPKLTRQSSVVYLASFLARAAFVDADTVSTAVDALLEWAENYLDKHADSLSMASPALPFTPGPKAFLTPVASRVRDRPQSWHGAIDHGVSSSVRREDTPASRQVDHMLFYSVCQATFYLMCFRGVDLTRRDAFSKQAASWERLLNCSLHPLRHCLDTVRREFARLCCSRMGQYLSSALLTRLADVAQESALVSQTITVGASFGSTPKTPMAWTPINKASKAGGLGRGSNPLDSFFPFDPYLLRKSHTFIDDIYNTWKGQDELVANAVSERQHSRDGSESESDGESDGESDCSLSSDEGDHSDMDMQSSSYRDVRNHISGDLSADRSKKHRRRKARNKDDDGTDSDDTNAEMAVSQQMADTYITESMSVTPSSSVAAGSLMNRSLTGATPSSFADDGPSWGVRKEDAFFHEDVSPSTSPPLASSISRRSPSIDLTVDSRQALF